MGTSHFQRLVKTLTVQQQFAIKETMLENFGDNMQTGFDMHGEHVGREGLPYLACRRGPKYPVVFYVFHPDGTVTKT